MVDHSNARAVLRAEVTRDDIDDALALCGLRMTNVFPGSDAHPGQVVYATRDRRSHLHLVEDTRLGVVYLAARGPTAAEALAEVQCALPTISPAAALAEADGARDPRTRARALAAMVLCAGPSPTAAELAAMLAALSDDVVALRRAALVTVTYAPWPELAPRLAEIARSDPDPGLRSDAERLLTALYPR